MCIRDSGQALRADPQGDRALRHRLGRDVRRLDDPRIVLGEVGDRGPQDLRHLAQVFGQGDRHVDLSRRPALRVVADSHDLAVADVPHHPRPIPQPGHPQADVLDHPNGLAGVDGVTDAVLCFDDHEDPRDEVLDQALRAEPDCDTTDSGRCKQGPQGDVEGCHDREGGDRRHRCLLYTSRCV